MIRSDTGVFEGEGGTVLRWRTWMPESPIARVILVHGLGEHSGRYQLLAGALAGRGMSVFTYDQRGHGRSEGPRGHADTFEQMVLDLERAIREAFVRQPGTIATGLIAHSMGGLVALGLLRDREEVAASLDAAVVSAPWLSTKLTPPAWLVRTAKIVENVWPSAPFSRGVDPNRFTRDPVMIEAYRADRLVHGKLSPRFYFAALRAQERLLADARPYPVPLLFLVPGADPIVDSGVSRAFVRRLEGDVQLRELPGLRHEPFNEVEREEIFREVADWLIHRLSRTGHRKAGNSSPA